MTSFVGRRQELREVKRLLTTTRLLTLTGTGGAGKTRLGVRAAAEMSRGFPDGTWLVLLGSVHDPLMVPQAVFSALGVQDLSAGLSLSSLTEYLAGKRLLLMLDNCEHLLDACAVLSSTLLKACPGLHLLATSRQALGVAGEVRMVVPPMSLPVEDGASPERLLSSDAVWLLSERAAAVVSDFTVNACNAAAVLQLCRRLDGIPLALGLAAVRLSSLSLDQLNHGLAGELSILGSGNHGAEARQQTLEAAIGWSYRLLNDQERLLWARLSVFAGGFEEDAVIEVCADTRLPSGRLVGLLAALVDKSILKRELRGEAAPRYWLLETLGQFGRMRLAEFGEEATTQQRHLRWMCTLAESVGAWDGRQPQLFTRMDRERNNLWAALDFCQQQPGEIAAAADMAQHLMVYWTCRGPFGDTRRVLTSLAQSAPESSAHRARLLWVAAVMATSQNDYPACRALSEESLRIGTEAKDVEAVAWALTLAAIPCWVEGDLAKAGELVGSSLSLAQVMRVERAEMDATETLCGIMLAVGEVARAVELGERAVAMSKARGELWSRGYSLNFLAQAYWSGGDAQHAEALAREAVRCKHALDDRNGLTVTLETLAWIAAQRGQHERAACLLGSADRVRDESSLTLIELFRLQRDETASIAMKGLGQKPFDAAVARGRAMTIGEGVTFALEDGQSPKAAPAARRQSHVGLTRRETEVARLIADDLTNKQIATRLFLSERTVESHITNILNKLGLSSRIQITRWVSPTPS